MRLLLSVLFFIFNLQSWTNADDIRDFQIEGMSIGDSLLNYFSVDEINRGLRDYYKNKKFTDTELTSVNFKIYDTVHVNFKTNDKAFKIHSLGATILFKENINECYKKKDEIVDELSKILTNAEKKIYGKRKHPADKSGLSTTDSVWFYFNSGDRIFVSCFDWSNKTIYTDHLRVTIRNDEFNQFINDEYN